MKVVFEPGANLRQFPFNPELVQQAFTPLVQEAARHKRCRSCHGTNLTVSITGTDRTEMHGFYHCHDCQGEEPLSVRHNVNEIEKELQQVRNDFWKVFAGR
jgi:superfamily II helicase